LAFVQTEYFLIRLLLWLTAADLARGAAEPDLGLQLENFRNAAVPKPRAGLLHEVEIVLRGGAECRITGKAYFDAGLVALLVLFTI